MSEPIKTPPPVPKPQTVKISFEEANSSHVDDLLQRQASMRGERGMAAPRGRRSFFYQNWFIFALAAGAAAFVAWAIIEPFFNDHFYFEGPVEFINDAPLRGGGRWIKIKDQPIWLSNKALDLKPDDKIDLEPGKVLAVWAEAPGHAGGAEKPLLVGFRAQVDPTPSPKLASMDLQQQVAQQQAASMILLPLPAALIGLALGAADGIVCRLPRRALLGGGVGLLAG